MKLCASVKQINFWKKPFQAKFSEKRKRKWTLPSIIIFSHSMSNSHFVFAELFPICIFLFCKWIKRKRRETGNCMLQNFFIIDMIMHNFWRNVLAYDICWLSLLNSFIQTLVDIARINPNNFRNTDRVNYHESKVLHNTEVTRFYSQISIPRSCRKINQVLANIVHTTWVISQITIKDD